MQIVFIVLENIFYSVLDCGCFNYWGFFLDVNMKINDVFIGSGMNFLNIYLICIKSKMCDNDLLIQLIFIV